jgi:hypothetical protein
MRKVGNEMLFDCYIPPIPDKLPIKAPAVGLAFQRSNGTGIEQYLDFRKGVYMVNFGLSYRSDILVTVLRDTMYASDISSFNQYELQKMIESSLTGGRLPKNISINHENVPVEEFAQTIRRFNVRPEDLGSGRPLNWVQEVSLEEADRSRPFLISIGQNYPNPFNSETTIPFILTSGGTVTLEVYDILGRKVIERDEGYRRAGSHLIQFSAERLASGVYFYRMRGTTISETKRLLYIR